MSRPTIERAVEINGVKYEVEMYWDPGDPSVGICDGWEECCVSANIGGITLVFSFVPEYDKPVLQWLCDQIDVSAAMHPNSPNAGGTLKYDSFASVDAPHFWMPYARREEKHEVRFEFLGDFGVALDQIWTAVREQEDKETAELEEQLAEADLAAYEARTEGY